MPFDGITVSAICNELSSILINSKIDKIYQPESDEIIMNIRSYKGKYKLLLSASSKYPRVHLTNVQKENPKSPPMFCMLMRKHLQGSTLIDIKQQDLERIIYMDFQSYDELGVMNIKRLIIEIMGKHSNIILIDKDSGIIIDSIKRISVDKNRFRQILPAKEYIQPPSQDKINLLDGFSKEAFSDIYSTFNLKEFIYKNFQGISPSSAHLLIQSTKLNENKLIHDLSIEEIHILNDILTDLRFNILNNIYTPNLIYLKENEEISDFSVLSHLNLNVDNITLSSMETISSLIEFYYTQKDILDRLKQKSSAMRKLVQTNISKLTKKIKKLNKELNSAVDSKEFKIYGELITANLYQIKPGEDKVSLLNYYSPDNEYITIALDKRLSPSKNAQRYFKKYNKSKTAVIEIKSQIKEASHEIKYLQQVLLSLDMIRSIRELEELRYELIDEGYLRKRNMSKKKKNQSIHITTYISSDGFTISVGKNNKQNDLLTLKLSSKKDLWFHTKDIPGSHVVISTKGQEVPQKTIKEAAELAAYHSKGMLSSQVPVDYTIIKNVKKPNGAKLGMVIYDEYNTIYVTPRKDICEILDNKEK